MVLWFWLRFPLLKVYWVQCDGTEVGTTNKLVANGTPEKAIFLDFHDLSVPLHNGFAVA
ncbi:XisI protein [Synechocystis salina LEGE 06155]|nr:XisI protein [Synechocystis salina LEGE 06155]